jgi:DNA-directed RNA polymerase subunit RPC12/RpoP
MKESAMRCASCGSARIRRSRRKSFPEMSKMALGWYPFRCLDCNYRFWLNVLLLTGIPRARCPRCLGLDLTTWPARYHSRLRHRILLLLGAHRYRCAACRKNFVSFLPKRSAAAVSGVTA